MSTLPENNQFQFRSEQLNFILGVLLILIGFVMMSSEENIFYHRGKNVDILLLLFSGFGSFAVAFSRKVEVLYRVNVLLGSVSLILAVISFVVQVLNYTAWWEPFIHFNAGDVFFHIIVACAFFFVASRFYKKRGLHA